MTQVFAASHCGPRDSLEDRWCVSTLQRQDLPLITNLGVFDGVGGLDYGEVASVLARDVFVLAATGALVSGGPLTATRVRALLIESLQLANYAILNAAQNDSRFANMATTAVVALVVDSLLCAAWLGDSRCYVIGPNRIHRLTRDHSVAQEIADSGLISASDSIPQHTITQYLGKATELSIGIRFYHLNPGDVVLLCSDGFTDRLSDAQIAHCVRTRSRAGDFKSLPQQLVQLALEAGTTDNVTVVCHRLQPDFTAPIPETTFTGSYAEEMASLLCQENPT